MKHLLCMTAAKVLAAGMLVISAPLASAGGQPEVSWSVSVGSSYPGRVYAPPPVVYVEPQPVYVQPRPVYVRPQPVYVYGPVVQYGRPYYVEEDRHWRHNRHHGRHHHRHHRHHHRHD